MSETTVILVTHNSAGVVAGCLDALEPYHPAGEVIVVDNNSSDDTLQVLRKSGCRVVASPTNLGFGGGCNLGVSLSESGFVLLVNPDVRLEGPLTPLESACRESGLATGCLRDSDGRPQIGFAVRRLPTFWSLLFEVLGINRLVPRNPVNRYYRFLDWDPKVEADVEQPAGALLMVRRDVWERLGGMDERFYPVWFEDADFCRRALDAGFRIRYTPRLVAVHQGGHSVGLLPPASRTVYWYVSLLRYAAKHFTPSQCRTLCGALVLAAVPRMILACVWERSLSPLQAYGRVVRVALEGMVYPGTVRDRKRASVGMVADSREGPGEAVSDVVRRPL